MYFINYKHIKLKFREYKFSKLLAYSNIFYTTDYCFRHHTLGTNWVVLYLTGKKYFLLI